MDRPGGCCENSLLAGADQARGLVLAVRARGAKPQSGAQFDLGSDPALRAARVPPAMVARRSTS